MMNPRYEFDRRSMTVINITTYIKLIDRRENGQFTKPDFERTA